MVYRRRPKSQYRLLLEAGRLGIALYPPLPPEPPYTVEQYVDEIWAYSSRTVDAGTPAASDGSYIDDVGYAVWTYPTRTEDGGASVDLYGTIHSTSSLSAGMAVGKEFAGLVNAIAQSAGLLQIAKACAGQIAGIGNLSGQLNADTIDLAGLIAASGTVAGSLRLQKYLASVVNGSSSVAGNLQLQNILSGFISGQSSASAMLAIARLLAGSMQATSSTTGNLFVARWLAGLIEANSTVTSSMITGNQLFGSIHATSGSVGDLCDAIRFAGVIVGDSDAFGTFTPVVSGVNLAIGDFYWDNRTVVEGGGVLRVYTGSEWAIYATDALGWSHAISVAMDDILVWGADNPGATGDYVIAANAVFGAITTKVLVAECITGPMIKSGETITDVILEADATNYWDLVTGEFLSTIGTDKTFHLNPDTGDAELTNIPIRSYQGSGVQRRATQLDNDSLDWIDAPVSGSELLQARIGRLGVGGAVLMDGDFQANIVSSPGGATLVNGAASYSGRLIQLANGTYACMYAKGSNFFIVTRTSLDLITWNAENTVVGVASYQPDFTQRKNGSYVCVFLDNNLHVKLRISSDFVSWTTVYTPNAASSYHPRIIESFDGTQLICFYRDLTANIVSRTATTDLNTWSSPVTVAGGGQSPFVIQSQDGVYVCTYESLYDHYIYTTTSSNLTSWSSPVIASTVVALEPSIAELLDGTYCLTYTRFSDGIVFYRYSSDLTNWTSPVAMTTVSGSYSSILQANNGIIATLYTATSNNYLYVVTLQRYARIGAGIIESGSNSNGSYIKYGDGTMECWWEDSTLRTTTIADTPGPDFYYVDTLTYPAPFLSGTAPIVSGAPRLINGLCTCGGYRTATPHLTVTLYSRGGLATHQLYPGYRAIGRWKA